MPQTHRFVGRGGEDEVRLGPSHVYHICCVAGEYLIRLGGYELKLFTTRLYKILLCTMFNTVVLAMIGPFLLIASVKMTIQRL